MKSVPWCGHHRGHRFGENGPEDSGESKPPSFERGNKLPFAEKAAIGKENDSKGK